MIDRDNAHEHTVTQILAQHGADSKAALECIVARAVYLEHKQNQRPTREEMDEFMR